MLMAGHGVALTIKPLEYKMAQVQNANSDESPGMQNTESPGCQRLGQMECPIIGEATDRVELHIVSNSYTGLGIPGARDQNFATTGTFDATMLTNGNGIWEAVSKTCAKGTWNITMSFTPIQFSNDYHTAGEMKIYAGVPSPVQAYPNGITSSVDVPPGIRDGAGLNYFLGQRDAVAGIEYEGICYHANPVNIYRDDATLTTTFTFTSGCFFAFYFYLQPFGSSVYSLLGSFDFVATRV